MSILANMGLPMIFVQMQGMMIALGPIIAIEAYFFRKRLALSYGMALRGATLANLVSTVLGIPVAWFVLVIIQQTFEAEWKGTARVFDPEYRSPLWMAYRVLVSFAWLDPDEENLDWMIPLASALLLIPSYFVSVWIERFICRLYWDFIEVPTVSKAVTEANRCSYLLLFAIACGWLGWELAMRA